VFQNFNDTFGILDGVSVNSVELNYKKNSRRSTTLKAMKKMVMLLKRNKQME
jgi:hypothetical protein